MVPLILDSILPIVTYYAALLIENYWQIYRERIQVIIFVKEATSWLFLLLKDTITLESSLLCFTS